MKSCVKIIILLATTFCIALKPIMAQQVKTVYGKVLNAPNGRGKPEPFPVSEKVHVLAFNTVKAAQDALKQLKSRNDTIKFDASAVAGPDGYYEIPVAENGVLISQPDSLYIRNGIPLPAMYAQPNMRVSLQPYCLNCANGDTVAFLHPKIIQGRNFKVKGDPNCVFLPANHSWEKCINNKLFLPGSNIMISICDTVRIPDNRNNYSIRCLMTVEKRQKVVFQKDLAFSSCKLRCPLQFLDYSVLKPFETDEDTLATQLSAYIHANNAIEAQELADKLPYTEKYRILKSFAYSICGYYDFTESTTTRDCLLRKAVFEAVKESSPLNRVVMCMAICNYEYDAAAQEAMKLLPQNDALTYYLKAVLTQRTDFYKTGNEWAAKSLLEAFKRDSKLIMTASNDGDIGEDLYNKVMTRYEQEKKELP